MTRPSKVSAARGLGSMYVPGFGKRAGLMRVNPRPHLILDFGATVVKEELYFKCTILYFVHKMANY
jgi:hypothetical protein